MRRFYVLFILIFFSAACGGNEKENHAEDLDKAIGQIEKRLEQQRNVIREQEHAMKIIESNIELSHAEAMKAEYRREYHMKELMKKRAEVKVLNMDSILTKLKERKKNAGY